MNHLFVKTALIFICFTFLFHFIGASCFANTDCDQPEAPEDSRIYFLNGMRTSEGNAWDNADALRREM